MWFPRQGAEPAGRHLTNFDCQVLLGLSIHEKFHFPVSLLNTDVSTNILAFFQQCFTVSKKGKQDSMTIIVVFLLSIARERLSSFVFLLLTHLNFCGKK